MHDVIISIIVPLYNGQKWIKRTIESFFRQNVSTETYEVIVVDDCSADDSVRIIAELQKEYPSLKLISHDRNKRQGAARNTGIQAAKGKYILFCDQDDYFHPNILLQLKEKLSKQEPDVLVYGTTYEILDENKNIILQQTRHCSETTLNGPEFLIKNEYSWVPWNKAYRRQYLIEKGISFPENRNNGEDILFSLRTVFEADKVGYLALYCICNAHNKESVTRKGYSLSNIRNDIYTVGDILSYGKSMIKKSPETRQRIRSYVASLLNYISAAGQTVSRRERLNIVCLLLKVSLPKHLFLTDRLICYKICRTVTVLLIKR